MPERPNPIPPLSDKDVSRFWSRVDKREADACWNWTGIKSGGYGRIHIGRRHQRATRIAWFLATGADPHPLFVCHRCDNPSCVNPAHLWLGTHIENMLDMSRKGRAPRVPRLGPRKTHCLRGHEYSAENTRLYHGHRFCRACERTRSAARARIRAQLDRKPA